MEARDLHWDALRYVLDELEGEELLAFEGLLDSDQSAREAVASAVELAAAVRRGEEARASIPLVARRPARWRWAVAAMAAAALVAVVLSARMRPPGADDLPVAEAEVQSIALAWLDLRGDAEPAESASGLEGAAAEIEAAGDLEGMDVAPEPFAELAEDSPPAWLFEAADAYAERGGV